MKRVALFGATGAIGKSIAHALSSEGRGYRVVGRSRPALEQTFATDPMLDLFAEIVTWNPDEDASIRAAARGIDTLIYLVGVPYDQFHLHPLLMRRTIDAAVAEGVERIVLIGTVYPYGRPAAARVTESHPRDPHTYKGRMRKEQEDALLDADAAGRVRATILRLPDFYGPGVDKSFLHSLFEAAAKGGKADLVGPIDVPHEFVFVPDVGPVVTALAQSSAAYGRWWNLAGPGTITQREIVHQVFALAGRKPNFRVAGKMSLRLLGLFNPLLRELVEMHYLLTTPVLMDDSALTHLVGDIRKTPYAEGIERTLAHYRLLQHSDSRS